MASLSSDPERIAGQWITFRQVPSEYPPLWHPTSSDNPRLQPPGRWHRLAEGYSQYLALEPDGAWAELIRAEGLRRKAEFDEARRTLWLLEIDETDIADLSSFDRAVACGVSPGSLVADDRKDAQILGQELRDAGYRGVLAPSAALPGVTNLTLFGPRLEIGRREQGANDLPAPLWIRCSRVASECGPPWDLLTAGVRFHGSPHLGYEAWLAANAATQLDEHAR